MTATTATCRCAVIALAVLAAACTGPADEAAPGPVAAPSDGTAPVAALPSGAAAPQPAIPPPPAAVPPPPPPPAMDPAKLIGLDRRALTDLLGSPSFRRTDAPAELWRYRAGRCILDLFLYPRPDAPEDLPAVEHIEARERNGDPATARHCLDAVLKARAAEKTG